MSQEPARRGGPGVLVDVAALKAARFRKGWSQKELAERVGCNPRNVERAESNGTSALKTLKEFAEALNVGVEALVRMPPPVAEVALTQVPLQVPDYVGREAELERVTVALRPDGGVRVAAVCGLGGAGKSELAYAATARLRDHYPAAQLLVDLRGSDLEPMTADEAMAHVVRQFAPDADLALPAEQDSPSARRSKVAALTGRYRSSLAKAGPVLVVLDDARDSQQVRPLLQAASAAGFLITSRTLIPAGTQVTLESLAGDEPVRLLAGLVTGRPADELALLPQVAGLCAGLPLALRVAGDTLRCTPNLRVPDYLRELEAERARRLRHLGRDVEAVLALSAKLLAAADRGRAMRWQELSVFPGGFDEVAAASIWYEELPADWVRVTRDELTELMNRSLVRYLGDRYRLHDLLRPVARQAFAYTPDADAVATTPARLRAAEERFACHYLFVLSTCGQQYHRCAAETRRARVLFDREEENIRHAQSWAAGRFTADPDDAVAALISAGFGVTGDFIHTRLPPVEVARWCETAAAACRGRGDLAEEQVARHGLAVAWSGSGQVARAVAALEEVLAYTVREGHHEFERHVRVSLGSALISLGAVGQAAAHFEAAFAHAEARKDEKNIGRILTQLGRVSAESGDDRRAVGWYERALAIATETDDLLAVGFNSYNLGLAWHTLGDCPRAVGLFDQALAVARDVGDRELEGVAMHALGMAARRDRPAEAEEHHRSALAIAREDGDRTLESRALHGLGCVREMAGDCDAALALYAESLAISVETGDLRGQGVSHHAQGVVWDRRGDRGRALEHLQLAVDLGTRVEDRRARAMALACLANTLAAGGEGVRARDCYDQACAAFRELGDSGRELTAQVSLGRLLLQAGEAELAAVHFGRAAALAHDRGDEGDEGGALSLQAEAYRRHGDPASARAALERALPLELKRGDGPHGLALHTFGEVLEDLGDPVAAADAFVRSAAAFAAAGDRHASGTAHCRAGVAWVAAKAPGHAVGQYDRALAEFVAVRDLAAEGTVRRNLAVAWASLKQHKKAVRYATQALDIARQVADLQAEGESLEVLAAVHEWGGHPEKEVEYREQAVAVYERAGSTRSLAKALGVVGLLYAVRGDVPRAVERLVRSAAAYRACGLPREEGKSLGDLGKTWADAGDLPQAMGYYEQALAVAVTCGDRETECKAAINLALSHASGRRFDRAHEYAERALAAGLAADSPLVHFIRQKLIGWGGRR